MQPNEANVKIAVSPEETDFIRMWLRDLARMFQEGEPSLARLAAFSQSNRILDSLVNSVLDVSLEEARFLFKLAGHFMCRLESPRIEAAIAPFRPLLDGFSVKLFKEITSAQRAGGLR